MLQAGLGLVDALYLMFFIYVIGLNSPTRNPGDHLWIVNCY
jgi:hypothetical protein